MESKERDSFSKKYDLSKNLEQFEIILKNHVHTPILLYDKENKEFVFLNNNAISMTKLGKICELDILEYIVKFTNENYLNISQDFIMQEITLLQGCTGNSEKFYKNYYKRYNWKQSFETFLFIFYDITAERLTTIALEEKSKFKDLMIASVSHDIRTPLNASINFIEFSIRLRPDKQIEIYLQKALDSNKFLLFIVNDLLDYSQLNENKFSLKIEEFQLRKILVSLESLFENSMEDKNLQFILNYQFEKDLVLKSDKQRIERILINLLSNAQKFTFQGFVRLSVSVTNQDVIFSVEDSGIGIKDEDKHKLFKLYGSIKNTEANINSNGIGLGLTISNDIVCHLNNSKEKGISMESEYMKGSKFEFKIPKRFKKINSKPLLDQYFEDESGNSINLSFEDENMPLELSFNKSKIEKNFIRLNEGFHITQKQKSNIKFFQHCKTNILIIEDEISNMTILEKLLEMNGLTCDKAFNGVEAIDIIVNKFEINQCYKLILTDINMPLMNGYTFITKYKKLANSFEVDIDSYVIACTANATNHDKQIIAKYKFDDYIEKPVSTKKIERLKKLYFD